LKYVKVYADYAPSCLLRLTFLFAISTTPLLHAEEKVMPEEAISIAKNVAIKMRLA
jgi:hypothetical protein